MHGLRGFLVIGMAERCVGLAQGCAKNGERQNWRLGWANIAQIQRPGCAGQPGRCIWVDFLGRLCVADLGHCLHALGRGGGLADGLVGIICYGRKKALSHLGALG